MTTPSLPRRIEPKYPLSTGRWIGWGLSSQVRVVGSRGIDGVRPLCQKKVHNVSAKRFRLLPCALMNKRKVLHLTILRRGEAFFAGEDAYSDLGFVDHHDASKHQSVHGYPSVSRMGADKVLLVSRSLLDPYPALNYRTGWGHLPR